MEGANVTTSIALSDEQMSAIWAAAMPLDVKARGAFLEEIALEISRHPILGDGLLHRVIMQVQRKHFSPPQFASDAGASRSRRRVDDSEDDRPRQRAQPRTLGAL
jgi:hypothetical protein